MKTTTTILAALLLTSSSYAQPATCVIQKVHNRSEQQQAVNDYMECLQNQKKEQHQQDQAISAHNQEIIDAQKAPDLRTEDSTNLCAAKADKVRLQHILAAEKHKYVMNLSFIYSLQNQIEEDNTVIANNLEEMKKEHILAIVCGSPELIAYLKHIPNVDLADYQP